MKKIVYGLTGLMTISTLAISAISCSPAPTNWTEEQQQKWENEWRSNTNNAWDSNIDIIVKSGYDPSVQAAKVAQDLTTEFNRLQQLDAKYKAKPTVKINFTMGSSDEVIVQNVASNKSDFGISSISAINQGNHQKYHPVLQTTTNAFTFDKKWSNYQNGTNDDPLVQVANATNVTLATNPYQNQKDTFNGSIYPIYYDFNKQVDFYRGAIYIAGDKSTLNDIHKAWDQKDWNTFRNFGIVTGASDSGGQFLLEEKLLQKHFNSDNKKVFSTISQDRLEHPSKWIENSNQSARDLQNNLYQDFHIAFDDEGSFGYTKNNDSNYYNPTNKKLKILTVTEPLKYDIGIFRTNFNSDQAKLLAQAWINLSSAKTDTYGPSIGYNGYQMLASETIANTIYTKWNEVLK